MNEGNRKIKVMGPHGLLGWIDPTVQMEEASDVKVTLEDGRAMMVPAGYFQEQDDGYYLPLGKDQLSEVERKQDAHRESLMVVPVIAEQAEVSRRQVTTGRVRLHKRVIERTERVDTHRVRESVEVTHVPVNRPVEKAPEVTFEGDTMVIPVLEEVLVVKKQLVVREEVRVKKTRQSINDPQEVTLRSEEIEVERLQGSGNAQEE